MKYFSAFSGIGGFELAMPPNFECVGYSEIEPRATQIYKKHFNHKNYGDITKINEKELPDFDMFAGVILHVQRQMTLETFGQELRITMINKP